MGWWCIRVNMGIVCLLTMVWCGKGIGVNWGTQASHPLPPETVVRMLRENGIQKVKLFDADYAILKALGKTGIEVMVGIPNDMLASVGGSMKAAEKWVAKNVSQHISSNNVNVRYVAVGNEPFLETYNGSYIQITLPALNNIQSALIKAGIGSQVKVTVPLNADVYASSNNYPSGGDFRKDIFDPVIKIVKFLNDINSPFTVNIYPFISLYTDSNFPVEYAFFDGNALPLNDGGTLYYNMFDANLDTLTHALGKNGFGNLQIIVGEIGWPTDGDRNANIEYARRFNQGLMTHISGGKGTPMRPGPIDAYLFSLIDEDEKSIDPENFERHWGFFYFDGQVKYPLNLGTTNSGALVPAKGVHYLEKKWCVMKPTVRLDDPQVQPSVSYACGLADCTSLGYGTSCGNLDARGTFLMPLTAIFRRITSSKWPANFRMYR
ncbi:Glucan endo-1,3-beta-glucosidase 8 [Hibiscus syriacus]|uniref:glucan endo-1,3-beta-D-glucosidase n=1 Tax=Hibiscus syriacus TaxID=106335 RepID=A0A6A2Z6E7_HIBSY|nr:Glucan endo-1,3-beta-glucosidase 8 [Hibiscus syriacus]